MSWRVGKVKTKCNLRSEPNTNKPPLKVLAEKTKILINLRKTSGQYIQIKYQNIDGWIGQNFYELDSNTPSQANTSTGTTGFGRALVAVGSFILREGFYLSPAGTAISIIRRVQASRQNSQQATAPQQVQQSSSLPIVMTKTTNIFSISTEISFQNTKNNADAVKSLQIHLIKMGYYIGLGDAYSRGVNVNGVYNETTTAAVLLFLREFPEAQNKLDAAKRDGKYVNAALFEFIVQQAKNGVSARKGLTFNLYAKGVFKKKDQLYQIPSSCNYWLTWPRSWHVKDNKYIDYILYNIWGTAELVKLIIEVGKATEKDPQKYLGWTLGNADTVQKCDNNSNTTHHHQGLGMCIDIHFNIYTAKKVWEGAYWLNKIYDNKGNLINKTFNKEKARDVALLFLEKGAKRLVNNCKYVLDMCKNTYPEKKDYITTMMHHHHHLHFDLFNVKWGNNWEETTAYKKYLCCYNIGNEDKPIKCDYWKDCTYDKKRQF